MSVDGACPDGGTCHHGCTLAPGVDVPCYRVRSCAPLSGVYVPDDGSWPLDVVAKHGERFDVSVASWDFRRQITLRAGVPTVHVVEFDGHEYLVWPHTVNVYVSPTGRSVRVFVDGVEVGRRLSAADRRARKRDLAASSSTSKKARRVTKRLSASRVKRRPT